MKNIQGNDPDVNYILSSLVGKVESIRKCAGVQCAKNAWRVGLIPNECKSELNLFLNDLGFSLYNLSLF